MKNKYETDWELLPEMYKELVPNGYPKDNMKKGCSLYISFYWGDTDIDRSFWETIFRELVHIKLCS